MPLTKTEQWEHDRAERSYLEDRDATQLARDLTKFLNVMNDDHRFELLVSALGREHRALQQKVTRLAVNWLESLAELPENRCDMRNEASVKLAKKLLDGTDKYDRCLPSI